MDPRGDVDPPFRPVRLLDRDGKPHYFRLIELEQGEGYALYPLDQKQKRKQVLILPHDERIPQTMRDTLRVVPDIWSHQRMTAERTWRAERHRADRIGRKANISLKPHDLVGENGTRWEYAKHALRGIIGALDERNPLLRKHGMDSMFLDSRFRDEVLRHEAGRVGVDKAELKRLFFRWIRFGGDEIALMPRTGGNLPPGTPRTPRDDALRPGPMDAEEIESGDERTRLATSMRWRACIYKLLFSIIFETPPRDDGVIDVEAVMGRLEDPAYFWNEFRKRFYVESASAEEIANRPRKDTVYSFRRSVLDADGSAILRSILAACNKARRRHSRETPIPGGAATDRNADILETIEMDATEFRKIKIVARSNNGNVRRQGYATVIVACSRSTGAIVGWYVMIGRETKQGYRKCLYWVLADKGPLLLAVGLDPKSMRGIVSGTFDEVYVDRGPGSFIRVFVTGSAFMDIAITRPYMAVDKGTVEGVNRPLKKLVKEQAGVQKRIASSKQVEEAIVKRYAALPAGFHSMEKLKARERRDADKTAKNPTGAAGQAAKSNRRGVVELEMLTFIRIVAQAVNEINLSMRTDELALPREMNLDGVAPTRAAMHKARQAERVGDAAKPVDMEALAVDVLKFEPHAVHNGKIRYRNIWFGAGSEALGEKRPKGVQLLLQDAKKWADEHPGDEFFVDFTLLPDPCGLYAKWKREEVGADGVAVVQTYDLPATQKSLRAYGKRAGLDEALGINRRRLSTKKNNEISSVAGESDDTMGDVLDVEDAPSETSPEPSNIARSGVQTPPSKTQPAEYLPPPMSSRGIGGQKFDLDAWLKYLSK